VTNTLEILLHNITYGLLFGPYLLIYTYGGVPARADIQIRFYNTYWPSLIIYSRLDSKQLRWCWTSKRERLCSRRPATTLTWRWSVARRALKTWRNETPITAPAERLWMRLCISSGGWSQTATRRCYLDKPRQPWQRFCKGKKIKSIIL